MKRKLALLLASVMTVAAFPAFGLHAATNNRVVNQVDAENKTVMFEPGSYTSTSALNGDVKDNTDVEYWSKGSYLVLKFQDDAAVGESFQIQLDNAEWFFRSEEGASALPSGILPTGTGPITFDFNTTSSDLLDPAVADGTDTDTRAITSNGAAALTVGTALDAAAVHATPSAKETELRNYYTNLGLTVNPVNTPADTTKDVSIVWSVTSTAIETGVVVNGQLVVTVNQTAIDKVKAVVLENLNDDMYKLGGTGLPTKSGDTSTFDTSKGYLNYDEDRDTYTYTNVSGSDVTYTLTFVRGSKLATVTYTSAASESAEDEITIPLAIRTTASGNYSAKIITNVQSAVDSGDVRLGSNFEGKTSIRVPGGVVTNRTEFGLEDIYVHELKPGSLKNGTSFQIKAPNGYEFANNLSSVSVYVEGQLTWADGTTGKSTATGAYTMEFRDVRNSGKDYSVIEFELKGVKPSTTLNGDLIFKGLKLIATDDEYVPVDKELKLDFTNIGSTGITEESVVVAKVADFTVTLTRVKDEIPTLISGRLDAPVTYDSTTKKYDDGIRDVSHKAQTVKFQEKIADAWWSERTTKFSLPEEVTIMKVDFDKITNMADSVNTNTNGVNTKTRLLAGTNGDNSGVYYNTRKKSDLVTVKDNTLTLSTLYVQANKKASFEMTLWLSIAATYEGEITLKLDGSAIRDVESNKDVQVVIAKAVTPVKITTKVSEVKIGYQYFSVADFDIVENIAGALLSKETAYVTVTDGISIDMDIAKGFTATVTDGDLRISNVTSGTVLSTAAGARGATGSHITFDIDRESSKASTVSFKNVQVKVNRSVPYSNVSLEDQRGIDIYVWGPAVANNYYYLGRGETNVNTNDTFSNVPGISTKYINVVTLVDSKASDYANEVKVTIGNPVVLINGAEFTMPVAAYVSTVSNSTMVPVRFVANALGLPEESVKWDAANSTVTVDTGNNRIVQFQVGNTNYLVNGVSVPMVSPDGLVVACEISEERAFVPFRALGEAFGITVGWDAATTTATYNAPTVQ